MSCCEKNACCDQGSAVAPPQTVALGRIETLVLRINQMDGPTEERLLRQKLESIPGVKALAFNLMQRRLQVQHELDEPGPILDVVKALGMDPVPQTATGALCGAAKTVFSIENMDCPTEQALIQNKLSGMAGIVNLDFNLLQRRLAVTHTAEAETIRQALLTIGMHAVPVTTASPGRAAAAPVPREKWWLLGAGLIAAGAAEAMAWVSGIETAWPVILLSMLAIGLTGITTYKKGWIALKNRNVNINALMTIAVTGAVLIGQWPEAAMVMVLFALAEAIEALSLDRARNAIRGLMAMTPDRATVQQPNGTWADTDASAVALGAIVRVGPGERIALDGQLTLGQSAVNQAPITGESMPVSKSVGDKVFAGTVNETGAFEYRITAAQTDSTLARIIRAVEEAQGRRAPTQRFVDRFSSIYTPIVFALAIGVAVVPPLAFGGDWLPWVYKALVLLVIACPCALVISTPVTVVSGLAAAARAGILIKGGVYLEAGHALRVLALDKTGTITQGMPRVTDVVALVGAEGQQLERAASLAGRSDHPVSAAISRYHAALAPGAAQTPVTDFEAIAGRGTKGQIDGRWYYLGNHRFVEELCICNAATENILKRLEGDGKTVVVLCSDTTPLAVIAVADTVRETSRQAIAELHAMGVRTLLLTGDNALTASAIAEHVGIDDARGNLLPEDKLAIVSAELEGHGTVGMVGDGINDAPALAKASIGFAMGAAGTDTAIETADIALMDDDLRKIPQFLRLSRRASLILKQNIAFALSIKAVFLTLALTGTATLWMAVFADMGTSLIVVFNGLRLLRTQPEAPDYVPSRPAVAQDADSTQTV
jgi:Cd2+/Zn2+-exporting ATPase